VSIMPVTLPARSPRREFPREMLGAIAGAVAVAVVLTPLAPAAASAAPSAAQLEISIGGGEFVSDVDGALFAETPTLVPHAQAEAEFSVRNASESDGVLSIALAGARWSDLDFARELRVQATARTFSGSAQRLSSAADCVTLVTGIPLPVGATVPVLIELRLGELEDLVGQGASATFDLAVTLTSDARADSVCGAEPDLVIPVVPDDTAEANPVPRAPREGRGLPWSTVALNTMSDWFAQFIVIAGGAFSGILLWIVIRRHRRTEEASS